MQNVIKCIVELTKSSDVFGGNAFLEVIPVTIGFLLGALFVYVADRILDSMGVASPAVALGQFTFQFSVSMDYKRLCSFNM